MKFSILNTSVHSASAGLRTNIHWAIASWRSEGLKLLPGLPAGVVRSKFAQAGLNLPSELELLYEECGGMVTGEVDERSFELWPLEQTLAEAAAHPNLPFLAFGAGFLAAFRYLARIDGPHLTEVYSDDVNPGQPLRLITSSLDKTFHYLANAPEKLRLP